MTFQKQLKKMTKHQLWNEYCGYLDLSLSEYMYIQNRLMTEQIELWSKSPLGKSILKGSAPKTIEEFRKAVPLTDYFDYADILFTRDASLLPEPPVIWIETTWEGGFRPIKIAPYTRRMLDSYKHNIMAMAMLVSGKGKEDFNIKPGHRFLYGGAPLPYETGLIPSLMNEEMRFEWLPDSDEYADLSFSQRMKKGFKMAFNGGIDYFFAMGSVANYITENFDKQISSGGGSGRVQVSPVIAARYLKAKIACKKEHRKIKPVDLFRITGFACTGTDGKCYRDRLADAWGVTPVEVAAGTESTCVGCDTWEQKGMVFFPDSCFYEFIPESEMLRSLENPSYKPMTCLMDGVKKGGNYEIVISVLHGGAFMRYRIGDVYQCTDIGKDGGLPRFTYLDRIPTVIDVAGFTRITENSINEVIRISKLGIGDWIACKEYGENNTPFLHMYLEITPEARASDVVTKQVLTEHLSVYFRYFDSDYKDLKKLLNIEPLQISVLPHGSISSFEQKTGKKLARINADAILVKMLISECGIINDEGEEA